MKKKIKRVLTRVASVMIVILIALLIIFQFQAYLSKNKTVDPCTKYKLGPTTILSKYSTASQVYDGEDFRNITDLELEQLNFMDGKTGIYTCYHTYPCTERCPNVLVLSSYSLILEETRNTMENCTTLWFIELFSRGGYSPVLSIFSLYECEDGLYYGVVKESAGIPTAAHNTLIKLDEDSAQTVKDKLIELGFI